MSIRLQRFVLSGPDKIPATLVFDARSHLVFGPTDTGKSYVLHCLRYGLGGNKRPPDIGYSQGYTRLSTQILGLKTPYTLFRDVTEGNEAVYEGLLDEPEAKLTPIADSIGSLLVRLSGGEGKRILVKAGELQNLAAGDLRYLSLFDEIKTLNTISLVGSDALLKMRYRSVISLVLSGADDSQVVLSPNTTQRNVAKGKLEEIDAEIKSLESSLPEGAIKSELVGALSRVAEQIDEASRYLRSSSEALASLKRERVDIEVRIQTLSQNHAALREALGRFQLLNSKYDSDLSRLRMISTAASMMGTFETRPCPLCRTDLEHQARHQSSERDGYESAIRAAAAEVRKIEILRQGLSPTMRDLENDIGETLANLEEARRDERKNLTKQSALLSPTSTGLQIGFDRLSERRAELSLALRDLERLEVLKRRRSELAPRTKRSKQKVERDLSNAATAVCSRIERLLNSWGVPSVNSVYFDDEDADIRINQRQRVSFGKGKRAIFLTAYVTALMEHALTNGYPHLGFVAIDSPVVTYRDPKHGSDDVEEALDPSVKDRFYEWLADRDEPGQVIVLENEEPDEGVKGRLGHTEFLGQGSSIPGRRGFITVS